MFLYEPPTQTVRVCGVLVISNNQEKNCKTHYEELNFFSVWKTNRSFFFPQKLSALYSSRHPKCMWWLPKCCSDATATHNRKPVQPRCQNESWDSGLNDADDYSNASKSSCVNLPFVQLSVLRVEHRLSDSGKPDVGGRMNLRADEWRKRRKWE